MPSSEAERTQRPRSRIEREVTALVWPVRVRGLEPSCEKEGHGAVSDWIVM